MKRCAKGLIPNSWLPLPKDWLETSLGEMPIASKCRTQAVIGHDSKWP